MQKLHVSTEPVLNEREGGERTALLSTSYSLACVLRKKKDP